MCNNFNMTSHKSVYRGQCICLGMHPAELRNKSLAYLLKILKNAPVI